VRIFAPVDPAEARLRCRRAGWRGENAGVSVLDELAIPIVQAPLAGGPSTPRLAASVSDVGALGFLAAGYLTVDRVEADIAALRALTDHAFGVNVFVTAGQPAAQPLVDTYARSLEGDARRLGVPLGSPRFDDDGFADKVALLCRERVPVVSFTFGLPPRDVVARLRAAGTEIWLTVTSPDEAVAADVLDPDVLVVQGVEAGGHRGTHVDDDQLRDLSLLAALQLVGAQVRRPLVAPGGIATGAAVAATLAGGAAAAQLGTAYLRCPEAGTAEVHRTALTTATPTVLTRAFSGRLARGVRNRFHDDHGAAAPRAYPEVHHLTAPLRAHGRNAGDGDVVNLWAGQTHELAGDEPAATLTLRLAAEARQALHDAAARLGAGPAAPAPAPDRR
jgi:nitronate monooxygenase